MSIEKELNFEQVQSIVKAYYKFLEMVTKLNGKTLIFTLSNVLKVMIDSELSLLLNGCNSCDVYRAFLQLIQGNFSIETFS